MNKLKTNCLDGEYIAQHRDPNGGMNAVIIYEQCDLALKANALLERAALSTNGFHWDIRPWRLQFVLSPASGGLALADSIGAHLIVLALPNPPDLSPSLLNWLEAWAKRRLVADAGLAVFDGSQGDLLDTPLARSLSPLASRHGLCLLKGAGRLAPLAGSLRWNGQRRQPQTRCRKTPRFAKRSRLSMGSHR